MKISGLIFTALSSALLLLAAACSDDEFIMNSSFINSDAYAEYTDQTPIELSTFRLDSVQTSGQNMVWVGRFKKPVIGDVYSESYIRMSEPSNYGWAVKEKFDSITIVLRHTGDYEGDTMKAITIDVKRLAQPLEFAENESSFYNVRSFRDSTSIGKFRFVPKPHSRPRVRFRLNDSFGMELVNFIKRQDSQASDVTTQEFRNLLGGIKVTFQDDPESMLAFRADSVKITIHSHMPLMERVEIERTLTMINPTTQFNHVWNENMDEPYETLTQRYKQVTESEGGLHSALFEGLGYYTRVNFPSLEDVVNRNYGSHVVRATLKIYPERDSYDKRRFPSTFYLTEINRGNVLQNPLYTASGNLVSATLVNNILDEDKVYYYADITYYINTVLAQEYILDTDGIVLTWGNGMSPTDYNFMLFNGHGKSINKSILELYYYNYDMEER